MSLTTFRDFIGELDRKGDLELVEGCDWDLEIGTLTELAAERWGPALLFDKIKDYPVGFRVLANPYSTPNRTTLGLDLPEKSKPLEVV
ncbi:MAG: UbiD family decarboxylase, partial [Nitrososphaerales archaeon]